MPWARDDYAQHEAEEWCRRAAANFIKREELSFLILARASHHHVGNITALRFDWSVPRCEIGYWLRSGYTGRGYMTEAVNELTRLARDTLKSARIEVRMDAQNERSWRVAERCGFTLEGTLRHDFRYPDGRLRDTRVYSKIK
jgi:RimJ/RimL family protein N-acetyltransferase